MKMFGRILAALDGSGLAEQVLPHIEALAEKFDATVVLLLATSRLDSASVAASPPQDPTQVQRAEQHADENYLTMVADRLRAKGYRVEVDLPVGAPAEQIIERARATGVDLIAMTTHGRGGLGRLVFGSVATEVLQKATCPVFVVRIDEAQGSAK
jgi:nucleotide-binding universal stress UspA family protein